MDGPTKGAEKASCGETVVQKGVFGESVSSFPLLPPSRFVCFHEDLSLICVIRPYNVILSGQKRFEAEKCFGD